MSAERTASRRLFPPALIEADGKPSAFSPQGEAVLEYLRIVLAPSSARYFQPDRTPPASESLCWRRAPTLHWRLSLNRAQPTT